MFNEDVTLNEFLDSEYFDICKEHISQIEVIFATNEDSYTIGHISDSDDKAFSNADDVMKMLSEEMYEIDKNQTCLENHATMNVVGVRVPIMGMWNVKKELLSMENDMDVEIQIAL